MDKKEAINPKQQIMKKTIKTISLMFMAAATLSLAACSKDDSSNSASGGSTPTGGKQLAKVTQILITERQDNGEWTTTDYRENSTTFTWSGNHLTTIGYNNASEEITYDNDGRITKITSPENETYTPTYDDNGRIVKATRVRTTADGQQRTTNYVYTYNDAGQVIKKYETRSSNNNRYEETYIWENGNIVRIDEKDYYAESGDTSTYSHTYTYDNKVNVFRCLPSDFFLASGSSGSNLSKNNQIKDNVTLTYSGDYPVKRVSTSTYGNERETSTQYYEYTDGTGRR